jgi:hypothetical protein
MPRKPVDLPPGAARTFVDDMRAFFAESDGIKRDEIAARQAWLLAGHVPGRKRRTNDVVVIFHGMKDQTQ